MKRQDRPYDMLVVGELNVDIILTGNARPEWGQVEKLIGDLNLEAGSSPGIFAASAARMGMNVLYSSTVGNDALGRFMLDKLNEVGIGTEHVRVDEKIKSGACVILSEGQDRAMLTFLGTIAHVTPDNIDPKWYGMARHLHVASPFLLTGLYAHMPEMMKQAQAHGMTTSLDTNWDPEEEWALDGFFDHLDVFLPNENEIRAIAGEDDLERAIDKMAERVSVLVVKMGAEGAIAVKEGKRIQVPAYKVQVADTTGAGDTFDGAFLAGYVRGEPLERCLMLGMASGALTVQTAGGFNGQATWEDAERVIGAGSACEGRA